MSKRASSKINRGNSGALTNPWIVNEAYRGLKKKPPSRARGRSSVSIFKLVDLSESEDELVIDETSLVSTNEEETLTASSDLIIRVTNYDIPSIRKSMKRHKELFGLSYEDLGKLTGINHNATRRFIVGEINTPREQTLERYQALAEIFELLYSQFDSMPLIRKKVLTAPNEAFENKSLVNFSNELGEDGIFFLRGEVKRMYE